MPRRPHPRAESARRRRDPRRDAANQTHVGRRTRARANQEPGKGSFIESPQPQGGDDEELGSAVTTLDENRGGPPSRREMYETFLGRKHLLNEKWVVVENFASEAWVKKMLAMEREIRRREPERVKPLRFEGSKVNSHREAIVSHPCQDDRNGSLVHKVSRRLERVSFRSSVKGKDPSHRSFRQRFLVSTGTRDDPAPVRTVHAEFDPYDDKTRSDGGYGTSLPFSFGVLIALQDGTRVVRRDTGEEVSVPRRGAIIFHAGFAVAEAEYRERNVCLHVPYNVVARESTEGEDETRIIRPAGPTEAAPAAPASAAVPAAPAVGRVRAFFSSIFRRSDGT